MCKITKNLKIIKCLKKFKNFYKITLFKIALKLVLDNA